MTTNKRLSLIIILIGGILLVPFIGSQLSSTINWTVFDYIIAATLLLFIGGIIEVILKVVKNKKLIPMLIVITILIGILLWIELAVGVFDSFISGS